MKFRISVSEQGIRDLGFKKLPQKILTTCILCT